MRGLQIKITRRNSLGTIHKCSCGNERFFIHTEKLYEGCVDSDGILVCEPEEQHIVEIKCSVCGKVYEEKDFKDIDY